MSWTHAIGHAIGLRKPLSLQAMFLVKPQTAKLRAKGTSLVTIIRTKAWQNPIFGEFHDKPDRATWFDHKASSGSNKFLQRLHWQLETSKP